MHFQQVFTDLKTCLPTDATAHILWNEDRFRSRLSRRRQYMTVPLSTFTAPTCNILTTSDWLSKQWRVAAVRSACYTFCSCQRSSQWPMWPGKHIRWLRNFSIELMQVVPGCSTICSSIFQVYHNIRPHGRTQEEGQHNCSLTFHAVNGPTFLSQHWIWPYRATHWMIPLQRLP